MRQYVIDELRPDDYQALKVYLDRSFGEPEVDGLYWVPLELSLYTDQQQAHSACHPLCFAWEL